MKRFLPPWLSIAALALLVPAVAFAQADMPLRNDETGLPIFHLDAASLLSTKPGEANVLVYVDISYDRLQFVRSGRGYEANYEVDLSALTGDDEDSPRFANRIWRSTVITDKFEQTTSPDLFNVSQTSINMPPGTYLLVATLTDLETRKKSVQKKKILVPAFTGKGLEMGDLVIARQVRLAPDGAYEIVPNVERKVLNSREPIYVYYEIYPNGIDSLKLHTRVLDSDGKVVRDMKKAIAAVNPITRGYTKIELAKLPVGHYVVEMQVAGGGKTTMKGSDFRIHLSGLPGSVGDLDTAIREMRYIASTGLIKKMLKAPPAEKEKMFVDFWKKKDPSPGTAVNELEQEYYDRIARANQLFGSFRDGWETDRGEVYVRFGPPSEIERHPFEINSRPYEIWYYYDIQRRFVFVDEMGYGEYRLVSNLWR